MYIAIPRYTYLSVPAYEPPLQQDASVHDRGRKYQRLKAAAEAKETLRKYEPFLVHSRNFEWVPLAAAPHQQALFCTHMQCQL